MQLHGQFDMEYTHNKDELNQRREAINCRLRRRLRRDCDFI